MKALHLLGLCCLIFIACGGMTKPPVITPAPSTTVMPPVTTAPVVNPPDQTDFTPEIYLVNEPLFQDYQQNPVFADSKYLGKWFTFVLRSPTIKRGKPASLTVDGAVVYKTLTVELDQQNGNELAKLQTIGCVQVRAKLKSKIGGEYTFEQGRFLKIFTPDEERAWTKDLAAKQKANK